MDLHQPLDFSLRSSPRGFSLQYREWTCFWAAKSKLFSWRRSSFGCPWGRSWWTNFWRNRTSTPPSPSFSISPRFSQHWATFVHLSSIFLWIDLILGLFGGQFEYPYASYCYYSYHNFDIFAKLFVIGRFWRCNFSEHHPILTWKMTGRGFHQRLGQPLRLFGTPSASSPFHSKAP